MPEVQEADSEGRRMQYYEMHRMPRRLLLVMLSDLQER